jgi:hypothetical protein
LLPSIKNILETRSHGFLMKVDEGGEKETRRRGEGSMKEAWRKGEDLGPAARVFHT